MDATEKMFKIYSTIREMSADAPNYRLCKDGFYRLISDGRVIAIKINEKIILQKGGLK